jgi:hypothetical protein
MLLETVLGGALGGIARLAPEVLKLIDRKNERKHELDLLDKNTEAEKARAAAGQKMAETQADSGQVMTAISALQEALKGQFQPIGNAFIDGLNFSVRPVLTYLIAGPYALGKLMVFAALLWTGNSLDAGAVKVALDATYTAADMAIVSGIINFFFLGRVFDRRGQ